MENYQRLWGECLALIKEKVNNERVFNTWFACVEFESFDEQKKQLIVRVPSKYVYEYLEQYGVRVLSWAIKEKFKVDVILSYRILREPAFEEIANYLRQQGWQPVTQGKQHVKIANAEERLRNGLRCYFGEEYKWLSGYERIADWLTDNKGRGLLLVGVSGLGKTKICRDILPVILGRSDIPFVPAREIHGRMEELKKAPCVIIDDLGKEEEKFYGNKNEDLLELLDAAEQRGNILIINTNLSTTPKPENWQKEWLYPTSIKERYGDAVLDRMRATMRAIEITGKSMRK